MSEEELTALRAEYAAMSRRDWKAILSVAHRDFELLTPGGGLEVERIRGVESARRAFEVATASPASVVDFGSA